jgi:N-methylhydantoinase B
LRRIAINGEPVHPKGRYVLAPGDRIDTVEAGGGGYGDPRRRARDAIAADLRSGFVTPEAARRDYGYEIEG